MNVKVMQLNTIQQIWDEFRIIALIALITAVATLVYVAMNLLWTAVVYFGFLLFISLIYGTINYDKRDGKVDNDTR